MDATKTYKCLIVDDETLARQLITTHLNQIPNLEIIHSCSSAIEADLFLKSNHVDLMFLDIQMPNLSGINLLKSLLNPPKVILTTAYSEFALEGYELNIVDYLLKPITFERFYKAASKAIEIMNLERKNHEPSSTLLEEKSILIKSSHQLIRIELLDIAYVEGLHKYVKIVTEDKNYTTLFGLTAMEKELPAQLFYRCHRSFIVNLVKIEGIDGNQAIIGKHRIPISKPNKPELIAKLGKRIG